MQGLSAHFMGAVLSCAIRSEFKSCNIEVACRGIG